MVVKILTTLVLMNFQIAEAKLFSGATSAALGNAGVGTLQPSEGVFINPGQLGLYETQNFGLSYTSDQFLVHFADNGADALFPASLGYSKARFGSTLENSAYHLNLAHSFFQKNVGVGIDLQYRTWKDSAGQSQHHSQTVADLGIFAQIKPGFTAGLTVTNLALNNTVLSDTIDRAIGTFAGVGIGNTGFAKFRFDIGTFTEQTKTGPILRTGLQTEINDWILTRIGYELNEIVSSKTFTLGLAFVGPQFGLHYAYQKESNDLFEERHVIDLNVPF
jgi:hypothetical protein